MSTKISILEENARRNLGIGAGMLAAGAGGTYAGANYMANELNPIINKKHGQLVDTQDDLNHVQDQLKYFKQVNDKLHGLQNTNQQLNNLDKGLEHSGQTVAKVQGLVDQGKVPQSVLDQHVDNTNKIVDNKLDLMNNVKHANELNQTLVNNISENTIVENTIPSFSQTTFLNNVISKI